MVHPFNDWKNKLGGTLNATWESSTLVLQTMDQISKATLQIRDSIFNAADGSLILPQVRDSIRLRLLGLNVLGKVHLAQKGPIFALAELFKPNPESLLGDIP